MSVSFNWFRRTSFVIAAFLLLGCADIMVAQAPRGVSKLILSSSISNDFTPRNQVNQFGINDSIYALLNIYDDNVSGLPIVLETRWYNGSQLVAVKKFSPTYKRLPHRLWFSVEAKSLGVGLGHVEVFDDKKLIMQSQFEVLPSTRSSDSYYENSQKNGHNDF